MTTTDVAVVGAGAAGLFCAGLLGQGGLRVVAIDHAPKLGEKIRISGGGRCNFTNRSSGPANFLSRNPNFVRGPLARYTPADFMSLMAKHRIAVHEKHRGQMFCDGSATQVVDMLIAEARSAGVVLQHPTSVEAVSPTPEGWRLRTNGGEVKARALVVATGGLPVPAIGASGWGLDFAAALGLPVTPIAPALVPLSFTATSEQWLFALAGVALEAEVSAGARSLPYGEAGFREDLLITHKGLSGPAILQASSHWAPGTDIVVNWLGGQSFDEQVRESTHGRLTVEAVLACMLPQRLAQGFAEALSLTGRRWAELGKADRLRVRQTLEHWVARPAGTLGWKKAEVMLGGVDTHALESRTMAVRGRPNLSFIGEAVDVTGHLGGHNFQWAWASAFVAAQGLLAHLRSASSFGECSA
jgi:hypothetical protein